MASDDVKQFLLAQTGVPMAHWKRLNRTTGRNGAVLRMFEERGTGRRVLTQDLDGTLSILADSREDAAGTTGPASGPASTARASTADAAARPSGATAPSVSGVAPEAHPGRRFAIVLCEDPSFDDAEEALLEHDPSFDRSYRWFTTLRLEDDERTRDPRTLAGLRAALPEHRVYATDEPAYLMTFEDLLFVARREAPTGVCTSDQDRKDLVDRLQAKGWTFDPTVADRYVYLDHGVPVPAEQAGPIVVWRPGMPRPIPQSESPAWAVERDRIAQELDEAMGPEDDDVPTVLDLLGRGGLVGLGHRPDGDAFAALMGLLMASRGGVGRSERPRATDRTAAARFSFAFGENPELSPGDWQHEWLEIYDAEDEQERTDHLEGPLREAGVQLPPGLDEVVEGTFDYRMGDPTWTREDLFPLLLATGMTWDRDRCALAASGFDPDDGQASTPWWQRGL